MAAVLALALAGAAAAAGCGLGAGEESDQQATLTVTRDYGEEVLLTAEQRPTESETVMRFLDGEADIETRYGGGFVQSIDGVEGGTRDGRRFDWFFYVNGIEADRGAAEFRVRGGDRVFWDHRDWTDAMRVPAVVGAFPEPLLHGYDGRRWRVRVRCLDEEATCDKAASQLKDAGVEAPVVPGPGRDGGRRLRVLVGPWMRLRDDPAAALLDRGPARSGVFARFGTGGRELRILGPDGHPKRALRVNAGLVAAVRPGDGPPTWIVTGTDSGGVQNAIELLVEEELGHHYAVVTAGAGPVPVPVP
jgi:hypothetical protein